MLRDLLVSLRKMSTPGMPHSTFDLRKIRDGVKFLINHEFSVLRHFQIIKNFRDVLLVPYPN
jgi:hypothetical protein